MNLKTLIHILYGMLKPKQPQSFIGTKQRAYGIDLSRWEPEFDPAAATPGLIDFGIIKASEGTSWKDQAFEGLYPSISQLSVTGAYHYLKSGSSGVSQANFFVDTIKGKEFDILAIDFESYNNILNDAFVRILYDCLVKVTELNPTRKVILYTNPDLYDTIIYPASIRIWGKDVFTRWDLWIAQYYFIPNPDGEPAMPKRRADWVLWQFSDAGDPIEHGTKAWVDRNVFNGTKEQLLTWVGKSTTTPPVEGDTMHYGTVKSFTNIRSTVPGGAYVDIGDLQVNDEIVADTQQVVNGYTWWHLVSITRGGANVPLPGPECWCYGVNVTEHNAPTPSTLPTVHVTLTAPGYATVEVDMKPL